ncbi:MAG: DUF488 domain-containing protein [Proteobacteria bacterium]|nr:DUF488 domain-containing protein [Pseudomonadota bacterium]MBS0553579.1 DUF488 domain-containing protein [Pseudomonadota bacterium]
MSGTLYTIGFTRKGAERFFGLLADAGVRVLLDTRARPDSQLAGFARGRDLAWFLQRLCGIDYVAIAALAPGNGLLADYRRGALDWTCYARRYLAELNADAVMRELAGISLDGACLLCAEDSPDQCHRRLAAEWLQQCEPTLRLVHLR